MAGIDPALFRKVMGAFATGVTIITSEADGEVHGMTANAFMSGSLEPPLCIVSIARKARMHDFLLHAGHFGVSMLGAEQADMSNHFAGRPMADLQVRFHHAGRTPLVEGAIAAIAADTSATHDCGDHTLFIGRIHHMACAEGAPLVVHHGKYARVAHMESRGAAPTLEFW